MSRGKVYEHNNVEYRDESIKRLRDVFAPGTEVRTVVRHVSRSGMFRVISVLAIESPRSGDSEPRIVNVSHDVARVVDWSYDNDYGGLCVTGCGMDMCFHVVYTLSRVLYRDDAQAIATGNHNDAGYLLDSRPL